MSDRERESEVFRAAAERLGIRTTDAPRLFGVTRQTMSSWAKGNSKVPKAAFVKLLEMENEAYQRTRERMGDIKNTARAIEQMRADAKSRQPDHL